MTFSIHCPRCQARLRLSRAPATGRMLECPQCKHRFAFSGISASPASDPIIHVDSQVASSRPFLIAAVASMIVVTVGLSTVLLLTRGKPELQVAEKKSSAHHPTKAPPESPPPLPEEHAVVEVPKPVAEEPNKDPAASAREFEQKNKDFIKLMIQAGIDNSARRFPQAIAGYTEALKIMPGNEEAERGLRDAQAAFAEVNKNAKDEEKVKESVAQLNKNGALALEAKQYAAAAEFFKLALQKDAADADAIKGLVRAQEALATDQAEKKKQADFDKHIAAGRAALKAGNQADAIREFIAAQQILPASPLPGLLRQGAENQLAALKNQQGQKKELDRLLDQANAAFANQRYVEAEQLYRQALKIAPNDALAKAGLADASRRVAQAKDDYARLMTAANLALMNNLVADALAGYRQALLLFPNDPSALQALRNAEQLAERVNTYAQAMNRAGISMNLKNYADAVFAYNVALKAVPNDAAALAGLQNAQQRLAGQVARQEDFDRLIKQAQFALKMQNFAGASQQYREAFKLYKARPPLDLQRQANYADAMAKGLAAMNSQDYKAAVPFFQSALQEIPNDFLAQSYLINSQSKSAAQKTPPKKK